MRDGMLVLPMFMGCGSPSSLQVLNPSPTKPNPHASKKQEKTQESLNNSSTRYHSFPKARIASGIHKLIQTSSKSFSQVFVYKQVDEDQDMEIGAPTDVKHVTHIGIGECDTISFISTGDCHQ